VFRTIYIAFAIACLTPAAGWAADMSDWEAAVTRRCPTHHLEHICDGCYDSFLDDFERTLPKVTQHRIRRIADYAHRCTWEVAGFSCEMSVHVDAMNRLGLLKRFVAFGCAHYRCEEAAMCTRQPPSEFGR